MGVRECRDCASGLSGSDAELQCRFRNFRVTVETEPRVVAPVPPTAENKDKGGQGNEEDKDKEKGIGDDKNKEKGKDEDADKEKGKDADMEKGKDEGEEKGKDEDMDKGKERGDVEGRGAAAEVGEEIAKDGEEKKEDAAQEAIVRPSVPVDFLDPRLELNEDDVRVWLPARCK